MTAGLIYSCKWRHGFGSRTYCGWDMLLFIRKEYTYSGGKLLTNYRFHDMLQGETRLLDEGLVKHCKELFLEEV